MDPMAAIRQTFFQECEEGLADLEAGLLRMDAGETDDETVNAVFRAVHSIKGGAGAFSLDALVRFAHVFETTLDYVRSGKLAADSAVVAVMLRANDVLADLIVAARDDKPADESRSQALVGELQALIGEGEADDGDGMDDFVFEPVRIGGEPDAMAADPSAELGADPGESGFVIRFRPVASLYAKANDPLLLFRELATLGELACELDAGALPPLDGLEPEASYLAWTLTLRTDAPLGAVREVFDFVDGDCELQIEDAGAASAPAPAPVPVAPAAAEPMVDIAALIARVTAFADPPAGAGEAHAPAAALEPPRPLAAVQAPPPAAAAQDRKGEAAGAPTIRVDLERVDRLIDLVGELVINQAMLSQRMSEEGLRRGSPAMVALDELEQLTREIQDSVMAIRAQPVRSVFQRMPRLVRETAALVHKQVRLVTDGEGTEVDKTVIERLSDPLTHMIRNAIDHGVETPETRVAAGKPAEGTVRLSALHRSGRIVIEVADDGAGINRARVRQIAVERGLIAPDAALSDEEVDNLIFMAGFSTASTVSDISGRGVGMDVVRRSIQALGGRISIASRPGEGSTFTLSLPLTLAVLDGMVVSVGDQTLVAPLTAMIETLKPQPSQVHALGGGQVIAIRDAYLPLVDVGQVLGYRSTSLEPASGVALLVETEGGARSALLVDAIQGQRQVVIKSLEANFQHVPGIAAATILGDGRVALILDVDALVDRARGGEPEHRACDPLPTFAMAG